jgi:hypothetical protein
VDEWLILNHSTLKPIKALEDPAYHRGIHSNCYRPWGSRIILLHQQIIAFGGMSSISKGSLEPNVTAISLFKYLQFRRPLSPKVADLTTHESHLPLSQL